MVNKNDKKIDQEDSILSDFLVDLHIHSNFSICSLLTLSEIIEYCNSYKIKGIALTDHNSLDGYEEIKKIAQKYDIIIFLGYELRVKGGELLIYGIPKVLPLDMDPNIIIKKVKEMGGAVIAAHPFRGFFSSFKKNVYDLDIDGIEVTNRPTHSFDQRALTAAIKMEVAMIAGSDAHNISDIGWCATKFKKRITSTKELISEIIKKRVEPILL